MPRTDQGDISKDILSGIAITTLIFTVSVYIPIVGFFSALFIPLPTLFYRSKLGRRSGAIIPGLTIVLVAVFLGGISIDILYFFELLLLGFVLSELFELNLTVEKTILYACGAVLTTGIACLLFYSVISDTGVIALISNYVAKNLKLTLALYENMGVSPENIRAIAASLDHIQYVLIRIIPAIVFGSTCFISWGCLLLAKPMLTSKNLDYPAFGSLNRWKAPEHLVWGAIGAGTLLMIPAKALKIIGLNGLLILLVIYFFQGIAIVSFYFDKKKFPRIIRVFLYSLIALQQVILLMVIGLGFFDIWLNFRKLQTNNHD